MGNSSSAPDAALQTLAPRGGYRQALLQDLVAKHREAEEEDFYEVFGLERYARMDAEGVQRLRTSCVQLLRRWHPDKNPPEEKEACEVNTVKVCLARRVLLDPDLKRRYDVELRRQREETDRWSTIGWYIACGWNVVHVLGGLSAILVGVVGVPMTAGASTWLSLFGSMALTAGIRGSIKLNCDPDCSTTEYLKEIVVGYVHGTANTFICNGFAAAAVPGASLAAQLGNLTLTGASIQAAGHIISDCTDALISEGLLGPHLRNYATGGKTAGEVFSLNNGAKLAIGCAAGPLLAPCAVHAFESREAVAAPAVETGACLAHPGGLPLRKVVMPSEGKDAKILEDSLGLDEHLLSTKERCGRRAAAPSAGDYLLAALGQSSAGCTSGMPGPWAFGSVFSMATSAIAGAIWQEDEDREAAAAPDPVEAAEAARRQAALSLDAGDVCISCLAETGHPLDHAAAACVENAFEEHYQFGCK